MKKIAISVAVCMMASLGLASESDTAALQAQIDELKKQIVELKAMQTNGVSKKEVDAIKREITAVKKHDAMDNIKFSADFRTAYDIVDYKLDRGSNKNNGIWTNKLILGMSAQPVDNLIFRGSLGAYKTFGNNTSFSINPYQAMDWYGTQSPSDSTIRLREAYFLYMGQMGDIPYTASLGRRPSTDGFLAHLREDNPYPQSPTGHNINMEFDGASFKLDMEEVTSISGLYFKLCLGRGNSNVEAKYPTFTRFMGTLGMADMMNLGLPYSTSNFDSPNMDLAGIIAQLYDDGQYKVLFNFFKAWNVMGANFTRVNDGGTDAIAAGSAVMQNGGTRDQAMQAFRGAMMDDVYAVNMTDVGDMTGGALSFRVDGIGDGWSDFLDDTTAFASFAWSKTDPKGKHSTTMSQMQADGNDFMTGQPTGTTSAATTEMLGSSKSETGTSYYVGLNMPGFFESDRIGLEYNHGSKYWRSFTYGEDTLAGSKLATRGDAYEIYYNLPLVSKNLTAQIRYTYMNYDYSGSHMFFGSTGTPMSKDEARANGMDFVESASDIRLSLRYRY